MGIRFVRSLPAAVLLTLGWGLFAASVAAQGLPAAAAPAAASGALPSLLQRYASAQRVALTEQVCLAEARCVTNEARLLEALETSRRLLQAVADLAEAGDAEAAYQRGMLSLAVMEKHAKRLGTDRQPGAPARTAHLRRLISTEAATAQRYLGRAAQADHAPACRAMAGHLAQRMPPPEPVLVARLYLCAVRGFAAQGSRTAALDAFASMREAVPPTSMELVEAYSLLFRSRAADRSPPPSGPEMGINTGEGKAP
ncbi:MAG: hypothetical protein QUV35_07385 [Hydrogenophaga sp.]|uniref:hypothetical protein n=1 Tax=Hydrogenophaga sp. TaxID=1904254 RepID=UPI002623BFBE|nr:hypothetical protein [Hydrogenophaga sp.]MDM7942435.1 hypothetical protein [Hydrogenophaga sp.]